LLIVSASPFCIYTKKEELVLIFPTSRQVQEWKEKAVSSESKTKEVEAELSMVRSDLERLRKEQNAVKGTKWLPFPMEAQNELEKRIVVCSSNKSNNVTENRKHSDVLRSGERKTHGGSGGFLAPKRSPLRDIGNSSLLMRQNGKAVFPL